MRNLLSQVCVLAAVGLPGAPVQAKDSAPPRLAACATDSMDKLPVGTLFRASPALVKTFHDHEGTARDPMDQSSFAHDTVVVTPFETVEKDGIKDFHSPRIIWADGSAVSVYCELHATGYAAEFGAFALKKATVRTKKYLNAPDGRIFRFELDNPHSVLPTFLSCEVTPDRIDKDHPYASFDKTLVSIGQLENLLFRYLPMSITTETDPGKCTEILKLNPPANPDSPSVTQGADKPPEPELPGAGAPAPGDAPKASPAH